MRDFPGTNSHVCKDSSLHFLVTVPFEVTIWFQVMFLVTVTIAPQLEPEGVRGGVDTLPILL